MLVGLNWTALAARLDTLGLDASRRARVEELLSAIEAGALAAAAQLRAERAEG